MGLLQASKLGRNYEVARQEQNLNKVSAKDENTLKL